MTFAPFLAPERDELNRRGRPKRAGATYYSLPFVTQVGTATTGTLTAGEDWYAPIYVSTPIVVDQLACEVTTTAAGNLRMGLYRATADWQPLGAPVADSGDISTSTTGIKTYTPGTPVYLPRGRYLTVFNTSTSGVILTGREGHPPDGFGGATNSLGNVAARWRVTRAYAAFPTPGTAWDTVTQGSAGGVHVIFFRVLTP